jgi:hypothetical protein
MLTIKVHFSDGFESEVYNTTQFKRVKDQIVDPLWIEENGHCIIDRIQVGFGDNWVRHTAEWFETTGKVGVQ